MYDILKGVLFGGVSTGIFSSDDSIKYGLVFGGVYTVLKKCIVSKNGTLLENTVEKILAFIGCYYLTFTVFDQFNSDSYGPKFYTKEAAISFAKGVVILSTGSLALYLFQQRSIDFDQVMKNAFKYLYKFA